MPPDILHVAFSPLAVSNLRRALKQLGCLEPVIGLSDDLSFGPINPPDPASRARWVRGELRHAGWRAGFKDSAAWAVILQHRGLFAAWMSRRSAREYAGFLEFVWRVGKSPVALVDLTETARSGGQDEAIQTKPAGGLDRLSAEEIVNLNLLGQARTLSPEMCEDHRIVWHRLREENAALRVLDCGLDLKSVPITFFDQQLLSFARDGHWLKAARIIGEMFAAFDTEGRQQAGDLLLIARLPDLVELGLLESRGDLSHIRYSEVRLPLSVRTP